jgi:hypothetical protein
MLIKRVLEIAAVMLLTSSTFAQSNQLRQLASQLTSEATGYAETTYNNYSRSFRNNNGDIETVMMAQQFSAGAQLFNRMVNDRRRNQELRDAFQLLRNSWRSPSTNDIQRNRWNNLDRLMSDITRELNYGDSGDNNPFPNPNNDQGGPYRGSGRMTWRGRVDDDVRIKVRGGSAEVETIGGSPYYDAVTDFTASLPPRRTTVNLLKRRGRGEIFIEQQPSRENDYTAIVRIRDSKGGASDYEFELNW